MPTHLAVLKPVFDFVLGPPRGVPGRVRNAIYRRGAGVWAVSGPDPAGNTVFNFHFGFKRSQVFVVDPNNPLIRQVEAAPVVRPKSFKKVEVIQK
jgi:hypothetical protein